MTTVPPTSPKPAVAVSATDRDALPPGTRFGEFEILGVLGVGGFGIVYRARDHSLERDVALKEYMPASLAARGAGPQITVRSASFAETYAIGLRSFINEARLLARFDHPSLVKVYRFWEDNATAYMVMPFLQGTTLRDARRAMVNPPDEAWIRSVVLPILSALGQLHREGVFHRDIAPDNILVPREGPPVLLDFGAARRVISDRTQSLTAILKPSYAPIEQYAEMTLLRQGPWTDFYALGAVIHYLVFGVPPAPATARAVQDDGDAIERRTMPGISPRFLETMAWMLAVRPNQRPQSAEQLRAVLTGSAAIPPHGTGVTTLPNAAAGADAKVAAQTMVMGAASTRADVAFPATQVATANRSTSFSPTAAMPSVRPELAATGAATAVSTPTPTSTAMSMPTAMSTAAAMPPRSRRAWLVVAGGLAVVAIVVAAAWQLAPRRDAASASAGAAASTPSAAAAVAAAPPSAPARAAPAMIVERAEEARSAVAVPPPRGEGQPVPRISAPPFDTSRAPPRERGNENGIAAATPAASAAHVRAAARPVPRSGEEPPTTSSATHRAANNSPPLGAGNIGAVPYGPGNIGPLPYGTPGAAPPIERSPRPSPVPRESPNSVVPSADTTPRTAREVCGRRGFIARAVCMDQVCEEARFRSSPECAGFLARKAARENR